MSTDALLESFLGPLGPQSVLAVGPQPWQALKTYCRQHGIDCEHHNAHRPLPLVKRFDLGVIYNFDEVDKPLVRQHLGHLKNLLCSRIWALTAGQCRQWELKDFVGLGFVEDELAPQVAARSFSYNLETYNRQRNWNNPRFWANPHRWDIRF